MGIAVGYQVQAAPVLLCCLLGWLVSVLNIVGLEGTPPACGICKMPFRPQFLVQRLWERWGGGHPMRWWWVGPSFTPSWRQRSFLTGRQQLRSSRMLLKEESQKRLQK